MPVVLPTPEEAAALRVTDADHAARGAVLASSRHLRLTPAVWDRLWVVASRAGRKAAADARVTEQRTQAALIRCVVGNPFRPAATITPAVMASHGGGTLRLAEAIYDGRRIEDEHKFPSMTLRDVIKYSSNIGITQFVSRLSEGEEYQALRDVGFGMPTGVPYPEAAGTLRLPLDW